MQTAIDSPFNDAPRNSMSPLLSGGALRDAQKIRLQREYRGRRKRLRSLRGPRRRCTRNTCVGICCLWDECRGAAERLRRTGKSFQWVLHGYCLFQFPFKAGIRQVKPPLRVTRLAPLSARRPSRSGFRIPLMEIALRACARCLFSGKGFSVRVCRAYRPRMRTVQYRNCCPAAIAPARRRH